MARVSDSKWEQRVVVGLARELSRRAMSHQPETATAMAAGGAAGLEPIEVVKAMSTLIAGGYVREQGSERETLDPYTEVPIELTDAGLVFLAEQAEPEA